MIHAIEKATKAMVFKALKDILPSDRRHYGQDIRIWNDRDPRVDQSFFQGSVPGFVIGHDQRIVDWNAGFELVFSKSKVLKRGMLLSDWYALIENFKRLPGRESKLAGEAMLPITDRERVVYVSPEFGRMVFFKMMSPVLDRVTGRVIGWNVALNVNSVSERVKFFTALDDKIQKSSTHARFILGMDQISSKSKIMGEAVQKSVQICRDSSDILVIGSVGAMCFIEEILSLNPTARISVVDDDTDGLRHLRHKLGRFAKQIKIIRRNALDLSCLPEDRFDAALIIWPKLSVAQLDELMTQVKHSLKYQSPVSTISWSEHEGSNLFWDAVRRDLELRHEIDLVRWHMNLIKSHSAESGVLELNSGSVIGPGMVQYTEISDIQRPFKKAY